MQTEEENVETTVQHGIELLDRAGKDKDLLGMSLIYLHGGLESYFRTQLEPEIAQFRVREQKHPTWHDLLTLMEEKNGLTQSAKAQILEYNDLRNSVAHAKPHHITPIQLKRYAHFVQGFIGIQAAGVETAVPPTQPQPQQGPTPSRRDSRLAWLIPIFALFLVIIGIVWAFSQSEPGRNNLFDFNAAGTEVSPPPTITPIIPGQLPPSPEQPTLLDPPTPAPINLTNPNSLNPHSKIRIMTQTDIRTGPGAEYGRITLAPGNARYTILESSPDGGWYKVQLEPGVTGWISAAQTESVSP